MKNMKEVEALMARRLMTKYSIVVSRMEMMKKMQARDAFVRDNVTVRSKARTVAYNIHDRLCKTLTHTHTHTRIKIGIAARHINHFAPTAILIVIAKVVKA
jgi:uncharacterized membrane protein